MKEYIEAVRTEYDYILIDCMPSLGLMTINALVAADLKCSTPYRRKNEPVLWKNQGTDEQLSGLDFGKSDGSG